MYMIWNKTNQQGISWNIPIIQFHYQKWGLNQQTWIHPTKTCFEDIMSMYEQEWGYQEGNCDNER